MVRAFLEPVTRPRGFFAGTTTDPRVPDMVTKFRTIGFDLEKNIDRGRSKKVALERYYGKATFCARLCQNMASKYLSDQKN